MTLLEFWIIQNTRLLKGIRLSTNILFVDKFKKHAIRIKLTLPVGL